MSLKECPYCGRLIQKPCAEYKAGQEDIIRDFLKRDLIRIEKLKEGEDGDKPT